MLRGSAGPDDDCTVDRCRLRDVWGWDFQVPSVMLMHVPPVRPPSHSILGYSVKTLFILTREQYGIYMGLILIVALRFCRNGYFVCLTVRLVWGGVDVSAV